MFETLTIPGYTIKKKLGRGGMAQVYLGLQETLNRMAAIKVMNPKAFGDPKLSQRFMKEARTLSELKHPHIVSIYDVGQVEGYYYIAMEFFPQSLGERILERGKLEPEEALHMLKQIADALFYAHQRGIIHRDIKPDNIMFRNDNTPVVLDFGIAKSMNPGETKLTKTGMSIGTPYYMSPEQCYGEPLDGRSDVYALGVLLYEMLTGDRPYRDKNPVKVVLQHVQDPIPQLPENIGECQPLLEKMMAKSKDDRLQSKEELDNLLKEILNARRLKMGTHQMEIPPSEQETLLSIPTIKADTINKAATPKTQPGTPPAPTNGSPPAEPEKAKKKGGFFRNLFKSKH